MALRPGVQVLVRNDPRPRSTPSDTGVWFVVGLADAGPLTPVPVHSTDEFNTLLGGRVTYSSLYDALDIFFREGGETAYVVRVVGPAAVLATRNLLDAGAGVSLTVKAIGPGSFYNAIKVAVVAGSVGGTYKVQVLDTNNVVLEDSGNLTTQQDAVTWSLFSNYIRITLGATARVPAVAAAAALAGGADDRTNIVDANWQTALDAMVRDLGPGQVSAPGSTTSARAAQLLAHAQTKNRFALLDLSDSGTAVTLQAAAAAIGHSRYGMIAGAPWPVYPGVVTGTTRTVPPSAAVAGRIAANDAIEGPGSAAAGRKGVLSCSSLSQLGWDATTRDSLNTSGVNVIRQIRDGFRIYGFRSLADPNADPDWLMATTGRLAMAIAAEALRIGDEFVFERVDGRGVTLGAFGGVLTGVVDRFYQEGDIFGDTAATAYRVDVGPNVNTAAALANNELKSHIAFRPSPTAELVTIEVVNVPITEVV